jgi:protocatechuate 3,4-dioxygenase beta subunit
MRIKLSDFRSSIQVCIAGFWLFGIASAGTIGEQARRVQAFENRWKQTLFSAGTFGLNKQSPQRVKGGTGSISGTVHGLDSSAIGNAYVEAMPVTKDVVKDSLRDPAIGPFTSAAAAVNPDFTYTIEGLLPGGYILYAHADRYEARYFNGVVDPSLADTVFVAAGVEMSGIDFTLVKLEPGTGSISGVVLDAKNSQPVANAVVYVYSSDKPYYYGKNMADEKGRFVIGELKSGSYTAQVYADGYVDEIFDDADSWETAARIEVGEPNETSGIRFLVDRGGTISGNVRDMRGNPIPNAWVDVSVPKPADSSWAKPEPVFYSGGGTSTDENGAYRVTGLRKGEYVVAASVYDTWYSGTKWYDDAASPQEATPISITSGEEVSGIDFRFPVPNEFGFVSGKVEDLEGNPVSGAGIQVFTDAKSSDGFSFYSYGQTGPDGVYRIGDVPAGRYTVSCWAQSGWQYVFRYWPDAETVEASSAVTVSEAAPAEKIDFSMPIRVGSSVIGGIVRSTEGRALANASIQVMPAVSSDPSANTVSLYAWANTDSTGRYSVDRLPAGTYTVQCSYWENISFGQQWFNGAETQEAAAPVALGDREKRTNVDFNLRVHPIYGTITGRVTNAGTGKPIERAFVEIHPMAGLSSARGIWFRWWNTSAVTDADGRYTFEWLTEGEYQVSAYADGGFSYYKNAVVADMADSILVVGGEKSAADIAMNIRNEGPGVIRGKVVTEYGYDTVYAKDAMNWAGGVRIQKTTDENPIDLAVVIARTAVTAQVWPESERFYNTLSNPDGSYELKGLPAGEYYVQSYSTYAMPEWYNNVTDPSLAEAVRVEAATPVENINFTLSPMVFMRFAEDSGNKGAVGSNGTSINGRVTDAGGNPVAGAVVYLLNGAGLPMSSTNTNQDGSYALNGAPPGSYFIQASKLGFSTSFNGNAGSLGDAQAVVLGNGATEINISLATGVEPPRPDALPKTLSLYPNYPNPFNPATRIRFGMPESGRARVVVYDLSGRMIRSLWDGPAAAGFHSVEWDAKDASSRQVPSGVYFYRIEGANEVRTGKMVYLR